VEGDRLVVGFCGRAEAAPSPKDRRKRDVENFILIILKGNALVLAFKEG